MSVSDLKWLHIIGEAMYTHLINKITKASPLEKFFRALRRIKRKTPSHLGAEGAWANRKRTAGEFSVAIHKKPRQLLV